MPLAVPTQYYNCRLHTSCLLTHFPLVSFFLVNHLIHEFYDLVFWSHSSYFCLFLDYKFVVLLDVISLTLLSYINLCLKSLITQHGTRPKGDFPSWPTCWRDLPVPLRRACHFRVCIALSTLPKHSSKLLICCSSWSMAKSQTYLTLPIISQKPKW